MSLRSELSKHKPAKWKPRPEILLSPPIPLPMHGLAPRVVLGKEWWDETRYAAFRSTNYHCISCSDTPSHLEGHEVYDVDWLLGKMEYKETVPICKLCHMFIHTGLTLVLLKERVISQEEYQDIIARGNAILNKLGLSRKMTTLQGYKGPTVEWEEWRLVLFGKEYKPLTRSVDDYIRKYDNRIVEG